MRAFAAALTLALVAAPLAAKTPEETAAAALTAAPVWDGHNDVPEQLRDRYHDVIADFDFADTATGERPMATDLRRLRQGHVGAQFWSVFVNATQPEPQAVMQTLEQIDVLKRLVARYPADLQLALTADDVERAMKAGRIASLIGMEGGHSIGGSLGVLRQMYALGARYMTLTHYKTLTWADSADDLPTHQGLTPFGEQVVREMNRLGMIVDLAHVSADTMRDALRVTRAPVIFSHSNARALDDHPRGVSDAVLALVKANGGVVMVNFSRSYVSEAYRRWSADRAAEATRMNAPPYGGLYIGQPEKAAAALAEWERAHPAPRRDRSRRGGDDSSLRPRLPRPALRQGPRRAGVGERRRRWMAAARRALRARGARRCARRLAARFHPGRPPHRRRQPARLRAHRLIQ